MNNSFTQQNNSSSHFGSSQIAQLLFNRFEFNLHEFSPALSGSQDTRIAVMKAVVTAIGISHSQALGTVFVDRDVAEHYGRHWEAEFQLSETLKAVTRSRYSGYLPDSPTAALKSLPARLLLVAERDLDQKCGRITRQLTKGEYLREFGDFPSLSDSAAYDDATDTLKPEVANQMVTIFLGRNQAEVAEYAATFSPERIAIEHARLTAIGALHDNLYRRRGGSVFQAPDRETLKNEQTALQNALAIDFSQGRICPADLGRRYRSLDMEGLGFPKNISDDAVAARLVEILEKLKAAKAPRID